MSEQNKRDIFNLSYRKGLNDVNEKNQIILYGLGGARDQYRAMKFFVIYDEPSIRNIKYLAEDMIHYNPSIRYVYAIDNRQGLKRTYIESYKKNTIESCAIFKDILERYGLRII